MKVRKQKKIGAVDHSGFPPLQLTLFFHTIDVYIDENDMDA